MIETGRKLLVEATLLGSEIKGAQDGDLRFVEVDKCAADPMIAKHHYSHKPTSNSFCSLIVNDGLGVLQLGYGIRPKLKAMDCLTDDNWCEFDRMWLSDEMPKFTESRVIGLLLFFLKHRFPKIKYVISYADESAGNTGTIYRATNAIEIEGKEVDFYLLPNGERLHPVTAWHRHKTRSFSSLNTIYPGIIRIRGDNVQGDHPKEVLDKWKGKRQRKFLFILDKKLRRKFLGGRSSPSERQSTGLEKGVQFSPLAPSQTTMTPQTELAKRIALLFNRRLNTNWDDKEIRKYKQLVKDNALTSVDQLDVIERYYVYQRKRENGIHRRDLYTFLNNFSGELDRARAWDEEMRERAKRRDRRPLDQEDGEKPVNDNDWKRISDLAKAEMQRFKNQFA